MTMLYRSTDRRCRRGAPMKNLAHSASFESLDKNAPLKSGTKHLGIESDWRPSRRRGGFVWDFLDHGSFALKAPIQGVVFPWISLDSLA
jgi:hypothetical protein